MTPVVRGLLIWALLFCRPYAGQSPDSRDKGRERLAPLTLTNDRPVGYFPIAPETLAGAPPILAVSITRVVNPDETAFGIFVYLSRAEKGYPEPERILVGNFSLYPADHPGKFLMRSSLAFRKLEAAGSLSKSSQVRLVLEMRRLREMKPWTPVAVTIAPPDWQGAERQ